MTSADENPNRSLCVYCGSSPGGDPAFREAARNLGRELAHRQIRLVYGGGDKGLMGAVAEAVLDQGGDVLGIIPEFLLKSEQGQQAKNIAAAKLVTVPDMHTRKRMMFEESDAFLAMPGGIGTLEELVEVLTWAQLRRHHKPVGLLNINDFWTPYVELVEHMLDAGFLHNPDQAMPRTFTESGQVIDGLFA